MKTFTGGSARRRAGSGFTLLEVMVCVAVLTVLVGLATATISRSRQSTSMLRCVTNLRYIGNGFSAYAGNNNGFLPNVTASPQWEDLLTSYGLRRQWHFRCPLDEEIFPSAGSSYDWRDSGPPDDEHLNTFRGRPLAALRPDLVMSFEAFSGWHQQRSLVTVFVDGSVRSVDEEYFVWNLGLNARGGSR